MTDYLKRRGHLFLFLAPGLLLYGVFMAYPLISSLFYSFYAWDGLVRGRFVWFENFVTVLSRWPYDERFWNALKNNIVFFVLTFTIQSTLGLYLAYLLSKRVRGYRFFQAVYFLPHTLSLVVVAFLWLLLLNPTWGALAQALSAVGLGDWVRPWRGQSSTALLTIILVNAWQWLGFPILVFLAGLQAIPVEYREAATIDGASEWQVFWAVTLPLMLPTVGMMTILTFIWNFNAFELVFIMQGPSGSPSYATDLLATFFYRTAFGDPTTGGEPGLIGVASAIAVLMLLIIGVASIFGIRLTLRRTVGY
jgi:raffinose/stachyose/melibiose transport system permease protein